MLSYISCERIDFPPPLNFYTGITAKETTLNHFVKLHTSQLSSNVFKYCVFLYSKHVVATLLDSAAKNKHLMLKHLMYTYVRFTCVFKQTLRWRCTERDGVSNHRRPDCLLNRLFIRRSTKTSKLLVTGFSEGNPPVMIPLTNGQ